MPRRSWNTSTWPSVAGPAPMPITGTSSSRISSSVTALGIASNTIVKQPASCSASASEAIRSGSCSRAPLRLPAAERGRGLRCEAHVAHHRDARADDRRRTTRGGLAAALQLDRVAARLLDHPHRRGDRLLVRHLVGAERQIADQKRRAQTAAHRASQHQHVVELHRRGGVVAEHRRRRGVAHEHQVDARRLRRAGAGVVIGGDHHDRFAQALLLQQQRQCHRQPAGVGGGLDGGPAGHGCFLSESWLTLAL